jgi:hypothetical protein
MDSFPMMPRDQQKKRKIALQIVQRVHELDPPGRFLQLVDNGKSHPDDSSLYVVTHMERVFTNISKTIRDTRKQSKCKVRRIILNPRPNDVLMGDIVRAPGKHLGNVQLWKFCNGIREAYGKVNR